MTRSGSAAVPGQAADRSPIVVGLYGTQLAGVGSGVAGAAVGDPKKQAAAVIAWLNAHGGVGGRQVRLVNAAQDPTSSVPTTTQDQAACASFTEDNKAAVVISVVGLASEAYFQCLGRKSVVHLVTGLESPDVSTYDAYPTLASPWLTQDRLGASMVDGLAGLGYFGDAGTVVGVVGMDYAWFKSAAAAFKARAPSKGVAVKTVQYACTPTNTSSGECSTSLSNVILRLKQDGVNHVVLFGTYGYLNTFASAADQGGFYPRYGVNTQLGLEVSALNTNPAQLRESIGLGYAPASDVEAGDEPPPNAQDQLCRKIMSDSGQSPPSRMALHQAQETCEGFFLLKATLDKTGGASAPDSLIRALEALGSSYISPMTFGLAFRPGRHDGATTWRPLAYDLSCKCYRYTGGDRPFSG